MRDRRILPTTVFKPSTSPNLVAKNTLTSQITSLQTRAKYSKIEDLSAVSRVIQGKKAKLQAETLPDEEEKQGKLTNTQSQGKENWQKHANPSDIFSGGGSPLSASLMAKYESLMPGVRLGHVKVFQGSSVDNALARGGLQGLTNGTQVAVSSQAEAGTLEHELGHVAQRQIPGFNLTEGTRAGYEQDADHISARLVSNQSIKFQGLSKNQLGIATTEQAKCEDCENQERESLDLSAKTELKGDFQAWWDWKVVAIVFSGAMTLFKSVKSLGDAAVKCGKLAGMDIEALLTAEGDLIPILGQAKFLIEALAIGKMGVECAIALRGLVLEVSAGIGQLLAALAIQQSNESSAKTKGEIQQVLNQVKDLKGAVDSLKQKLNEEHQKNQKYGPAH